MRTFPAGAELLDPYPFFAEMRQNHPVAFDERAQVWSVYRHADVALALGDPETFGTSMAEAGAAPDPRSRRLFSLVAFDPPRHTQMRKLVSRAPWTTKLSMLLAADGWRDAALFDADYDPRRQAVVVAGHNLNALYQFNSRVQFEEEPDFLEGMTSLYSLDTDHAGSVSEVLQARGAIYTVGAACASGNVSLRAAIDEIRHHGAQVAIVVGAVLEFAPVDVHAMALMGAIAFQSFNDEPARASRPIRDRRR